MRCFPMGGSEGGLNKGYVLKTGDIPLDAKRHWAMDPCKLGELRQQASEYNVKVGTPFYIR